jgi:hypothetical protein
MYDLEKRTKTVIAITAGILLWVAWWTILTGAIP